MISPRQEIHDDLVESLADAKTGIDRKTVRTVSVLVETPPESLHAAETRIFYTDARHEEHVSIGSLLEPSLEDLLGD